MLYHLIPKAKMNAMRRYYIADKLTGAIAKELNVSTATVHRYKLHFDRIKREYPDRLTDMDFYIIDEPRKHWPTPLYNGLMEVLPGLIGNEQPGVQVKTLWHKYRLLKPDGYSYCTFKEEFYRWTSAHPVAKRPNLLPPISDADGIILDKWRHGNDHRKWQIAITLLMASTSDANVSRIMQKVDAIRRSVNGWISNYRLKGFSGLELPKVQTPDMVVKRMKSRRDNFFKLLQDAPKLHGLNRTTWSIRALHEIYNKVYNDPISYGQTTYCIKEMGYKFKKSRDVLISPDSKSREKIRRIQHILQKLQTGDKFFSIDEYGPVGIRLRGGRTLKLPSESIDLVPQGQKHRGVMICTAGIELSSNQVTHFYSTRKNTFEIIKLIEILLAQYHDQKRLFLSWDAASWHRSGILKNFIEDHNAKGGVQLILAPLPANTQYLNVIESVFGGLARTVIHNSNYDTLADCKTAVDRYFMERNAYFLANPKRAGNKIWGREIVAAKFKDTHNCRNRHAMSGVKEPPKC